MLAIQITSLKNFMSQLLISDAFDCFLLEEAVISTANVISIDGHVNREFYRDTFSKASHTSCHMPAYELRPWSEMKDLCFQLIKGKRTPLFCRFVLHLKPELSTKLLEQEGSQTDYSQVKALIANIRYDGSGMTITTCTSYHTFVPSKDPDLIWDKALIKFLNQKGIEYELL